MSSFFVITISAITALFLSGLVLFSALGIYILDSVAITLGTSFLQEFRQPLRDFLNVVVDPIFLLYLIILILVILVGLFLKKFRSNIDDSVYRLHYNPLKSKKVTVVLTAYNEEEVIGKCVKEFVNNELVNQVIVIDNGSVDNTKNIAENEGATVIRIEKNQGFPFACLKGLQESLKTESDIIILCEGDNTQSGRDVGKLLPYLENCDMVVGTRTVRALTEKNTQMSQFYIWGNYFIAFLISMKYFNPIDLTYIRLTDVGCVFRAIHRDSLKKIINKLESPSTFSSHMILVAIENNLSVLEVPVSFRKREGIYKGASSKKTPQFLVGLQMIWEIIKR